MLAAPETFPESHELAYSVALPRAEGERTLGSIALNSDREFMWTFDELTGQWHHHIISHWETAEYDKGEFVSSEKGMTVPPELFVPSSPLTSMYHIHPEHPEDIEHREVKSQLPSNPDIDACAKLCIFGYRDFRIVTARGVTTMSVASSVVESRAVSIKAFSLSAEEISEWTRTSGVLGAIRLATEFYTQKLNNLILVEFKQFPKA